MTIDYDRLREIESWVRWLLAEPAERLYVALTDLGGIKFEYSDSDLSLVAYGITRENDYVARAATLDFAPDDGAIAKSLEDCDDAGYTKAVSRLEEEVRNAWCRERWRVPGVRGTLGVHDSIFVMDLDSGKRVRIGI